MRDIDASQKPALFLPPTRSSYSLLQDVLSRILIIRGVAIPEHNSCMVLYAVGGKHWMELLPENPGIVVTSQIWQTATHRCRGNCHGRQGQPLHACHT